MRPAEAPKTFHRVRISASGVSVPPPAPVIFSTLTTARSMGSTSQAAFNMTINTQFSAKKKGAGAVAGEKRSRRGGPFDSDDEDGEMDTPIENMGENVGLR